MALNVCIDSVNTNVVNITPELNTYIINAVAGNTYTYNLPVVTCDGQEFTLVRIDGTTGIVNLVGSLSINNTSYSSMNISQYSTVCVMSMNGLWYVIYGSVSAPTSIANIFSAYFIGNSGVPYITITNNSTFLSIPFLGTSSPVPSMSYSSMLSTIVVTFGTPTTASSSSLLRLRRSSGLLICQFNIPIGSTRVIYNLSGTEKNFLPTGIDYLYLVYTGTSSANISSILFYA